MFRRVFVAASMLMLTAFAAQADKFVAGTHYEVVAEKATAKAEVKEFFSFYCGHCFHFEPYANKLASQLPQGIELEKVHVDFVQAAAPEVQNALARAYLVGKSAGQGEKVAAMIFDYIHQKRATFSNENDIRKLLLANDFDAKVFDAKINSMPTVAGANAMKAAQNKWSENRVLSGVPMLLINGKYKPKFEALKSENFEQELNELVNYLLAKKD